MKRYGLAFGGMVAVLIAIGCALTVPMTSQRNVFVTEAWREPVIACLTDWYPFQLDNRSLNIERILQDGINATDEIRFVSAFAASSQGAFCQQERPPRYISLDLVVSVPEDSLSDLDAIGGYITQLTDIIEADERINVPSYNGVLGLRFTAEDSTAEVTWRMQYGQVVAAIDDGVVGEALFNIGRQGR